LASSLNPLNSGQWVTFTAKYEGSADFIGSTPAALTQTVE
jgi:hypothetical protein